MHDHSKRVAILYAGDLEAKKCKTPNKKLQKIFEAFQSLEVQAEPVIYHDDFRAEVRSQLLQVAAVLVWVNPLEDGHDRSHLDELLLEVAAQGIFVSTHPDIILKLGTKEVLFETKSLGWGSDTHLYLSLEQMKRELPIRLGRGEARVLKQYRGQSGEGIWRVERLSQEETFDSQSLVRAQHAKAGCREEIIKLDEFYNRCAPYFSAMGGQGRMVDQIWQERITDGMVRCYLVGGQVQGFGRQEVVALHPVSTTSGDFSSDIAPSPTQRHYHAASLPEFQRLKHVLEQDWLPSMQRLLDIKSDRLPMLWDCDFMYGPKDSFGQDSYVLCEINVSCVSPFPDSVAGPLAESVLSRISNAGESTRASTGAR